MKRIPLWWALGSAGLAVVALVGVSARGADEPKDAPKNKVQIRTAGKDMVEIEVTSDRAFPVVNAMAVLFVGTEETGLSRPPKDGSTTTLIFTMTAAQFAKTKDGDLIQVKYNPDSQGHWDFGKLAKPKADK